MHRHLLLFKEEPNLFKIIVPIIFHYTWDLDNSLEKYYYFLKNIETERFPTTIKGQSRWSVCWSDATERAIGKMSFFPSIKSHRGEEGRCNINNCRRSLVHSIHELKIFTHVQYVHRNLYNFFVFYSFLVWL